MLLSVLISVAGIFAVIGLCILLVNGFACNFKSELVVLIIPLDEEIDFKLRRITEMFDESELSPRIYALSEGASSEALNMAALLEKEFEIFSVVSEKELSEVLKKTKRSDII